MGAPILSRQRLTAFAAETAPGTAILQSALVAANFETPVFNSKITDDTPIAERVMEGALSYLPGIPGATSGKAALETELFGSGTAGTAPAWDCLMKACGFAEIVSAGVSVTYGLQTGIFQTATLCKYDGTTGVGGASPTATRLRQLYGAMGTFKMSGKIGQTAKMEWGFDGVYTDGIAPVVPASIVFSTVKPPTMIGLTLTIGGTAYTMPEIEFDLGNKVELRENVSAASGYYTAVIVDRKPMFKVSPEALAYATQNWSAIFRAGTTAALNLVIGTGAGNIITITAPALQIAKAPEDQDEKDVLHDQVEFMMIANGSASDSELSIVLT